MDVTFHKKLLMACSFTATVFFLPALFSSATSAATLGGVTVITKVMSHSAWQDSWGAAWDECRSKYRGTKSLGFKGATQGMSETTGGVYWLASWDCHDK
ncbi:hypothetical protein U1R68_14295 [Pectobacterium colocasium]|uniref:hypothetical protein n=1 Tax=Pectobacterium TaxID=122277 RepID=UPI001CD7CA16|nr:MULTISPECIES: hypothetical protein [Pectobacterium]UYA59716.1 hypothetical protein NAL19_1525 [Pectobacterium sp. F1-1]